MHLDVEAERRLEAYGEELDPLCLVQAARAREERLEAILVLRDGAHALARRQFAERVQAQRRSVAQVQQVLEAAPRRNSLVLLYLDVPHLGPLLQIVGGHPNLLLLHDALLVEVGFAAVNEDERIGFAVIPRKIQFLESWRSVLVVLPCGGLVAGGRRRRLGSVQALDRLRVGID